MLIASRALQGIGGAGIMAISPAMVTSAFPPEQRGRAIGMNAVVVALGISTGPTLGGMITEHASWRYIFYVNVPVGLLGLLATARILPKAPRRPANFDPLGALTLGLGFSSFTALVSIGHDLGWESPLVIGLGAIAAVSGVVFAIHEPRHPHPIVDFSMFKNRLFAASSASLTLSFAASFAVALLLPFYFEQLRGFQAAKTGLLMTPFPLTIAVIAPISGAVADRIGTRVLATSGMVLLAFGLWLLSRLGADNSLPDIILRLVIAGTGQAMFQSPNNSALLGSAPPQRQGVASGILATGRVVGQSMSVAIAGTIFAALGGAGAGRALVTAQQSQGAELDALREAFLHGFRGAILTLAGVALAAAATALARGPRPAAVSFRKTDT
jgi:EmrB/QacA subfamily drug resistance transporter